MNNLKGAKLIGNPTRGHKGLVWRICGKETENAALSLENKTPVRRKPVSWIPVMVLHWTIRRMPGQCSADCPWSGLGQGQIKLFWLDFDYFFFLFPPELKKTTYYSWWWLSSKITTMIYTVVILVIVMHCTYETMKDMGKQAILLCHVRSKKGDKGEIWGWLLRLIFEDK